MTSNNNPDIDPANNDTLAGTLQFAFYKMMQRVNGMLPAQVIKYDRQNNRVQVQLLISIVTTNGEQVARPQIANIPVLALGGKNFFINFPLPAGSLGWVIAADRDISLFLQTYQQASPNTARVKNFADALFIPDLMTGYTIDGADTNSLVISFKDSTTRIAISNNKVTVTASSNVTVNAPSVTLNSNETINGTEHVTGTITGDAGANLSGTIALTGLGTFPYVITP